MFTVREWYNGAGSVVTIAVSGMQCGERVGNVVQSTTECIMSCKSCRCHASCVKCGVHV